MQGKSQVIDALPPSVLDDLKAVGRSIVAARKRRGMSQAELAERMYVSRYTLHRLESGDPGVGIASLASALFVLGMGRRLRLLAGEGHPSADAQSNRASAPDADELDF